MTERQVRGGVADEKVFSAVRALAALCTLTVLSASTVRAAADDEQVNEAKVVFDGVLPKAMRGGTWKAIYSSAEGPEGRALEVLIERYGPPFLRESAHSNCFVLPLEKDGGKAVTTKRDIIVLGVPAQNATLRSVLGDAVKRVPAGGYLIKTDHKRGRNIVAIAGDTPQAVLWGMFDFLDVHVPRLESRIASQHRRYAGTFFRAAKIPASEYATAPQTPIRSTWYWGQTIADYRTAFKEMARGRFNRAIIWNDQQVLNAREVVQYANSWGVEVFWGFSWGWTLSGQDARNLNFDKLADEIVNEWRTVWKPMGGDGIYFQSFTETNKRFIGGRSLPEATVSLVNRVASRILKEAPGTRFVFGLHSNSMRYPGAAEAMKKVLPEIAIIWENCGGYNSFPFWELDGRRGGPNRAFCEKVLALTPKAGLCWKAQLRMDWGNYVPPAGPFLLGCAGNRLYARDRAYATPRLWSFDEDWILNGKTVHEFMRHLRAGKNPPNELHAVCEYNPPYFFQTMCQAELFWSSVDSWEEIARRARQRVQAAEQ
jgi:hypothetical protein